MMLRGLESLGKSLVSQHLLFEEGLLCKAYFDFKDAACVYDAGARLTVVHKELLTCNLQCLSLFQVAHQSTKEVWLQDLLVQQAGRLFAVLAGLVELLLSVPDWSNSQHPNSLRHARVDLHFCPIVDCAKLWSTILDEELVVFNLDDLIFVQTCSNILAEEWLQHILK